MQELLNQVEIKPEEVIEEVEYFDHTMGTEMLTKQVIQLEGANLDENLSNVSLFHKSMMESKPKKKVII